MAIYNEKDILKLMGIDSPEVPENSFGNEEQSIPYSMEDVTKVQEPTEIEETPIENKETVIKKEAPKQQSLLEEYRQLRKEYGATEEDQKKPELSERELTLQALKRNIEEMQKEPEKKELTAGDYLPDVLAGLYNIYNFAQGSQQPSMKIGSIEAARKAQQEEEAARQGKIGKMQKLYTDYLGLLGKGEKVPTEMEKIQLETAKERLNQMKSGVIKEGKKYFNTSDGIIEVDQSTGETKLVRESVLAKEREERLKKGQEKSFELKDRLSDKQTERVESVKFASSLVNRIKEQLPDVEKFLGPYASRFESLQSYNPFSEGMDPEFAKFKANAVESLASYIKDKSGAQVSDKERKFLEGALPSVTDKPQEFKAKLDEFEKRLAMVEKGRLESIEKQGKDVSKFKKDPIIEKYASDNKLNYKQAEKILRGRGYNGKQ